MLFSRYRVYTVHINPLLSKPYEAPLFIEEGFSFTAFIFSGLWALYYRLWWPLIVIAAYNLAIFQMNDAGIISAAAKAILHVGFNVYVGFQANDWRRAKLANRGFILADIVTGDSLIRAEQRFFDRYFAENAATAAF